MPLSRESRDLKIWLKKWFIEFTFDSSLGVTPDMIFSIEWIVLCTLKLPSSEKRFWHWSHSRRPVNTPGVSSEMSTCVDSALKLQLSLKAFLRTNFLLWNYALKLGCVKTLMVLQPLNCRFIGIICLNVISFESSDILWIICLIFKFLSKKPYVRSDAVLQSLFTIWYCSSSARVKNVLHLKHMYLLTKVGGWPAEVAKGWMPLITNRSSIPPFWSTPPFFGLLVSCLLVGLWHNCSANSLAFWWVFRKLSLAKIFWQMSHL